MQEICPFVTTGKLSAVAPAFRLASVHPSFEGLPLFNSVLARQTVGYLLAGSLALLAIVLAALWLAARAHDHADEVSHDREVRNAYSIILSDLMDAETGQRGYLLTRSDRYLQPYEEARQKLTADLTHLHDMLVGDPSMAPGLTRLDSLANAKLAELAQTIRLENGGQHDDALALVNSDRGLKLMGAARDLLGELIADADGRVAHRLEGKNALAVSLCTEPGIELPTDKVVWLGVIVTELVTNAFKYAYAPRQPGEIRVILQRIAPGQLRLAVEDDGVGWSGHGPPRGSGLGTRVINAMATSLKSTMHYESVPRGTRAAIEFDG